jgi:telomerase protein component 1
MNDMLDHDGSGMKVIEVKLKGKKGKAMGKTRTIKKRVIIPVHVPDMPLIARYREAIDTAVRLSTLHNIKPIEGLTVVFCDVSGSMSCPCSTKGNMGSIQTVKDIAILLGLMCQDVCEECDFRIFSSPGANSKNRCDWEVKLEPNTILNNIQKVNDAAANLGGGTDFPYDYLEELIEKKVKIDNFIILSDMMIAPGHNDMELHGNSVSNILQKYRAKVNPELLFVAIDLYGNGKSIVDINVQNPKNVLITGFSDNILRYIAERGGNKQLEYVMKIDEIKLNKKKERKPKIEKKKQGKQEEKNEKNEQENDMDVDENI